MSNPTRWLNKAKQNLLPLSKAQDFTLALDEWEWTTNFTDFLTYSSKKCELCEHPDLRYIFEIQNRLTNETLWVGSECIKKFIRKHAIKGYLTPKEMGRELCRAIRKSQEQKRIDRLWGLMNALTNSFRYLNKKKWLEYIEIGFPLNKIQYLYELFETYAIPYSFSDFRIRIRKKDYNDIVYLIAEEYERFRPAFPKTWQKKLDLRFRQDEDK